MRIRLQAVPLPPGGNRFSAICAIACLLAAGSLSATSAHAQDDRVASWIPPHQMEAGGAASHRGGRGIAGFRNHVEAGAIVVRKSAPTSCLPGDLKTVLAEVAAHFGEVSVQSTHRSPGHNRRAGGASRSLHLDCRAIDFRVDANGREVLAFLREHPDVGGLKRYRNGLIHIDNGARRSW
jgi:hypothetical protein